MTGTFKIFVVLFCVTGVALAQTRPRPLRPGQYRPASVSDGKYRPSNDGKYRGGNDGKYVHKDVKYVHDDRPDAGYSGGNIPYKPDKNRFGNAGGGAGAGGGASSDTGAGSGLKPVSPKPLPPAPTVVNLGGSGSNNNAGNNNGNLGNAFGTIGSGKNLNKGKGTGAPGGGWNIIRLEDKIETDGYHYLYETENGILAEEEGKIQQLETDPGLRSKGFYEYTGDDGNLYRVDYVADDRGFVAQGDHLPPVPPHIPKLLAYLQANAPANKK